MEFYFWSVGEGVGVPCLSGGFVAHMFQRVWTEKGRRKEAKLLCTIFSVFWRIWNERNALHFRDSFCFVANRFFLFASLGASTIGI